MEDNDLKQKEKVFLSSFESEKMNELIQETTDNVKYFNDTLLSVANGYTTGLDNLMRDLYIECIKDKNQSVKVLEQYYLELSNMIYFMVDKLEQLSIYADMSKSLSKEVFSKSYLDNLYRDGKTKPTVNELTALAEKDSQYQAVLSMIYDRASRIVKGKIDSGRDMMNTLRKIISHRMNEEQLSMYGNSRMTPTNREETEE